MDQRFQVSIANGKVTLTPSGFVGHGKDGTVKEGSWRGKSMTFQSQRVNMGSLIDFINEQISKTAKPDEQDKLLLKKGWFGGYLSKIFKWERLFGSSEKKIESAIAFLKKQSEPALKPAAPKKTVAKPKKVPSPVLEKTEIADVVAQVTAKEASSVIPTPAIKTVLDYPGDLEKEIIDEIVLTRDEAKKSLKVEFGGIPGFDISVRAEDMFKSGAEAIVNAANTHLGGGGGIDGDIHKRGGKEYADNHQALSKEYNRSYTRGYSAMLDGGSNLRKMGINSVFVVVGPSKVTPQGKNELYSCYYNSLVLAHQQGKKSIAFPAVSTGIFGFPHAEAVHISLCAIYNFVKNYPEASLKTISIHFLPKEEELLAHYEAVKI